MWQYRRTVPALYAFKLFGIEASNKSFMYFLGLMVSAYRVHLTHDDWA